jgi:RNA polymerase sigma-70 factor (ECF subfamily)
MGVMDTARTVGIAFERVLPAINDEAPLVAELKAGSEQAFTYLLAVHQNPVFNLISRILDNPAEAPDVLQDVFMKVFKGIRQFHGDSTLKTWIYKIAVHEASNHRRGWKRRHWHEPMSIDDTGAEVALSAAEALTSSETPYRLLEQAERQELLRRALASLTQPYRTVVVLREIEGLAYEEIAQVTGMAEGTVKSRLMRGRELLRRKLSGCLGKGHV